MDTFTPWTIVVDLGIISALMLLGKLIRVKVKGIQRFLIPPAVLAGIMGLVLDGFLCQELSEHTPAY